MKTIDERANEFAKKNKIYGWCDYGATLRYGYLSGAAEQKAIDDDHFREVTKMLIDKACEAYCELCDYYTCCPFEFKGCYERIEIRKAMGE